MVERVDATDLLHLHSMQINQLQELMVAMKEQMMQQDAKLELILTGPKQHAQDVLEAAKIQRLVSIKKKLQEADEQLQAKTEQLQRVTKKLHKLQVKLTKRYLPQLQQRSFVHAAVHSQQNDNTAGHKVPGDPALGTAQDRKLFKKSSGRQLQSQPRAHLQENTTAHREWTSGPGGNEGQKAFKKVAGKQMGHFAQPQLYSQETAMPHVDNGWPGLDGNGDYLDFGKAAGQQTGQFEQSQLNSQESTTVCEEQQADWFAGFGGDQHNNPPAFSKDASAVRFISKGATAANFSKKASAANFSKDASAAHFSKHASAMHFHKEVPAPQFAQFAEQSHAPLTQENVARYGFSRVGQEMMNGTQQMQQVMAGNQFVDNQFMDKHVRAEQHQQGLGGWFAEGVDENGGVEAVMEYDFPANEDGAFLPGYHSQQAGVASENAGKQYDMADKEPFKLRPDMLHPQQRGHSLDDTKQEMRGLLMHVLMMLPNVMQSQAKTTGCPPLHTAAAAGFQDVVQLLLDAGYDANTKTKSSGQTALHIAAAKGHAGVVQLLLERGAEVNAKDRMNGETALHKAASRKRAEVVAVLLQAGADVNVKDETKGETALHRAASKKQAAQVVQLLLESGADVNAQGKYCHTPLHLAIEKQGNAATLRLLLEGGADVGADCCSEDGVRVRNTSPLCRAHVLNRFDVVEMMTKVNPMAVQYFTMQGMRAGA